MADANAAQMFENYLGSYFSSLGAAAVAGVIGAIIVAAIIFWILKGQQSQASRSY